MNNKTIPEVIKNAAFEILQCEGGFVEYLGEYKKQKAYHAGIKGALTGFPFVFLYDGRSVIELDNIEGLKVFGSLIKD